MNKIRYCKWCGKEFVPKHFNEAYCSCDCRYQGQLENARIKKLKKDMECKQPDVTNDMMVDATERLSKERGRYVSYGEVQKELDMGKLYVKDGVIVAY